jgi:Eco57I restriction-modification methylase
LLDYALDKAAIHAQSPQFETWLDVAMTLADKKHFFHWELEFPNIFFDSQGQPLGEHTGFDVVISNPPYLRQEQLSADKPFFQEHYEVYHSVADLFVYFFAQGLRLLRRDGRLAYISSNAWLHANYATLLRQYLRTQTTVETIIDLGDNHVFADAPDLIPAIQVVRKITPRKGYTAQAAVFARGEGITGFKAQLDDKLFELSIDDQPDAGWQLISDASRRLFTKLMAAGKSLGEEIERHMYRGVLTGLNEAFIIDQPTRDQLVKDDPACVAIIKPMLRGEDLRPWYQENEGRWLICIPNGWTIQTFPSTEPNETTAWDKLSTHHPGLAVYLKPFADAARQRQDKGQFWWELRPCDYYDAFEKPKIFWPPIGKYPRFSWDEQGQFVNNAGFFLLPINISLLGILQSRVCWFSISQLCTPLGERAGLVRYQQFSQFIARLPIPPLSEAQRDHIGKLAQQLTDTAKQRYEVRRKTTYRIEHDLGNSQAKLNQRLTTWWELSFKEFREELVKVFKRDIPLKDRDDWEALLRERTAEIGRLTDEIVRLETELNEAVYEVFGLDEEERKLVEQETKYRYGEW